MKFRFGGFGVVSIFYFSSVTFLLTGADFQIYGLPSKVLQKDMFNSHIGCQNHGVSG